VTDMGVHVKGTMDSQHICQELSVGTSTCMHSMGMGLHVHINVLKQDSPVILSGSEKNAK
jgi:hypothetical protein